MMRIVYILVGLTVIAVAKIHLQRRELAAGYDLQRLESHHAMVRREIWDRQVEIGYLMTPQAIRHRAEMMALDMTNEVPRRAVAVDGENRPENDLE
jgi:cell division protein FtsL